MMKQHNNSNNILFLSAIRILTILVNFLYITILSHGISLREYGVYSAANLIVSIAASLTLLGFSDASNYFFHLEEGKRKTLLNTVLIIQLIIGAGTAAVILLSSRGLAHVYDGVTFPVVLLVAFRPALSNIFVSLQPVQTAIGKARAAAIFNAAVMLVQLIAVLVTVYGSGSILTLLSILLLTDICIDVFFVRNLRSAGYIISPAAADFSKTREILQYSIPMGIYVMANSLLKDTDRLVISAFENTEALAVYTNAAQKLPLGIVSSACLTILIPLLTRHLQQGENREALSLCREYLYIGMVTSFILGAACILFHTEVIHFLYGEKYLSGRAVFILYVFADMIHFGNTTIILSAKGRTKKLMAIALQALAVNLLLNLLLYRLCGFVGPAIATVAVSLITTVRILHESAGEMSCRLPDLFDKKDAVIFLTELLAAGLLARAVRFLLYRAGLPFWAVLFSGGFCFCALLFALQFRGLKRSFQTINADRIL